MEDFRRLLGPGISARNVQEFKGRKLTEEWHIGFQMVDEIGEYSLILLNVGERHHRGERRQVGPTKHRELIYEMSDRRMRAWTADVEPGGKNVSVDAESLEKTNLFRLRFEVRVALILQNKIEYSDALVNEIHFMIAPVAKILSFHLAVEPPREQVIDHATLWKAFDADVFALLEVVPERGRAPSPMSARES